jgi:hypothetical protein
MRGLCRTWHRCWRRAAIASFRGRAKPIPPAVLFVASRAIIGVLRAAFEEQSPLLGQPELEDELAALVEGYVSRLQTAAG